MAIAPHTRTTDSPTQPASDPLPRWLPLVLLALTLIVLFHRLLLGDVLFWGLPSLQFYPWRAFAWAQLDAGHLPLWNPHNGAGAPLLANYQSALLYPPHLLHLLAALRGPETPGLLGMAHLFWAGLGMWLLTGQLGLASFGRGIATLTFPLSTTLLARFGTLPMIEAAAWLPWLVLAVERLVRTPRLSSVLLLAGVSGMQLLAGHAQWTFYSFMLAGLYAAWRALSQRCPPRHLSAVLIAGLLAVGLGGGLAAVQLLPTAELQRLSQRASGVNEAFALNFSFSPFSLFTLFSPRFFGDPGAGTYYVGGAAFEVAAFIGVVPASLALIGAGVYWLERRKRVAKHPDAVRRNPAEPSWANLMPFFCLAAAGSLVLAFGQYSPVFPFLYRHVPTFDLFQAPARYLLLTVFCLAMMAALASTRWRRGKRTQRVARLVAAVSAGLAVLLYPIVSGLASNWVVVQMAQGVAWLGALAFVAALVFVTQPAQEQSQKKHARWQFWALVCIALDLWAASVTSNPTIGASFYDPVPRETGAARAYMPEAMVNVTMFETYLPFRDYRIAGEQWQAYRRSGLPNLNLLDGVAMLNNFDPLRPAWFERLMQLLNDPAHIEARPALLRAAAARSVGDAAEMADGAEPELPRAWLVEEVIEVGAPEQAERVLLAAGWEPYQTAVIEVPDGTHAALGSVSTGSPGAVEIVSETPLELLLAVDAPGGGLLVLADTFYPGWHATLDGAETPIYRTNLAFRGVVIPPGNHVVQMLYQPASLAIGAAISGLSLLAYASLAQFWFVRSRRRSSGRPDSPE